MVDGCLVFAVLEEVGGELVNGVKGSRWDLSNLS